MRLGFDKKVFFKNKNSVTNTLGFEIDAMAMQQLGAFTLSSISITYSKAQSPKLC